MNLSQFVADGLLDAFASFENALTWPDAQRRIEALLERGLQRNNDFERQWPDVLNTLMTSRVTDPNAG